MTQEHRPEPDWLNAPAPAGEEMVRTKRKKRKKRPGNTFATVAFLLGVIAVWPIAVGFRAYVKALSGTQAALPKEAVPIAAPIAVGLCVIFCVAAIIRIRNKRAKGKKRVLGAVLLSLIGSVVFYLTVLGGMIETWQNNEQKLCQMNLARLAAAARLYALEHKQMLPASMSELGSYLGGKPKWLICPVEKRGVPEKFSDAQAITRYRYVYAGAGVRTSEVRSPNTAILFYEAAPHPNGEVNVVFLEGKPAGVKPEVLRQMLAKQSPAATTRPDGAAMRQ